jgi:amino acid adenylation domain-containing protein
MIFQEKLVESLWNNQDRVAIEYREERILYKDVLQGSAAIGDFLLKQGVGRETIVGVCLDDRVAIVFAMIGIARAGCVFVPIDVDLPRQRINDIVRDLEPGCILGSEDTVSRVGTAFEGTPLFLVEDILRADMTPGEDAVLWPQYAEDDALYIYYTSGTTGMPKGIVGKNCSLIHFLNWEMTTFNLGPGYRYSQLISPHFDAFLRDIFVPLLSGGTICIPPDDEQFLKVENIVSWINDTAIQLIHCVPSVFRIINDTSLTSDLFPQLKYILLSGEKINPAELKPWYALFNDRIQLVNLYGATETTMIRSYYLIRPEDAGKTSISIGHPIHDTELFVANKDLRASGLLEPGDLYILSDYMTRGYLNAPELTHEKFVSIPGKDFEGKMAFKTGDRARMFPGGKIDLIGREDRQVKLRGVRIELEEIEKVISASGLVKNAIVVKHVDEKANEMLIAFVIRKEQFARGAFFNDIRAHLDATLPGYMIPSNIIETDHFPLLSNGKINYSKLPDLLPLEDLVQPENEIERKLLSVWKEVLGDKPISTEDILYRIGGNSLTILRLISLIYREFSIRISLSEVFANPTIKKQAKLIVESLDNNVMRIHKAPVETDYPVSASQERAYRDYVRDPGATADSRIIAWELSSDTPTEKIENIIRSLTQRHEMFRTRFDERAGRLVQIIEENVVFPIERLSSAGGRPNGAFRALVRPFDMSAPPFVRFILLERGEGLPMLVAIIHPLICDSISAGLLYNEVLLLFQNASPASPIVQGKDYAVWESLFRENRAYAIYREFWLRNLEGEIPRLKLPVLSRVDEHLSGPTGDITFRIQREKIENICNSGVGGQEAIYPVLLSLYYIFLLQLTGQEDLLVGIETNGRVQPELEHTVGMFARLVPCRYRIDPKKKYTEFVADLQQQLQQISNNQLYDLQDILDVLNLSDTFSGELVETRLTFDPRKAGDDNSLDGVESYADRADAAAKYPLALAVREHENVFLFELEYAREYFTRGDMELLAGQFEQMILALSTNPGMRILDGPGQPENARTVKIDDILFNM